MDFKKGDKVTFLHDTGHGIVLSVSETYALIIDNHGFEYEYELRHLVPVRQVEIKPELKNLIPENIKQEKVLKPKREKTLPKIDLHIENLLDSHKSMSNHEILTTQISAFKRFLKINEDKQIPRMIVIHGLGEGRLKDEIRILVRGTPGASMHDADYQKYGGGASVIERIYNWR